MKKTILMFGMIIGLIVIMFISTGCNVILVTREGEQSGQDIETRQFDFSDFTGVEINSAFEYEIVCGDDYNVSLTTSESAFDHIKLVKNGQTLWIGQSVSDAIWSFEEYNVKVDITMPALKVLKSSGATDGVISGFSSKESLNMEISGASNIQMVDIAAGNVSLIISGASEVSGDLTASNIEFELTGASVMDDVDIIAKSVLFEISGASDVKGMMEAESVNVDISGASTIDLSGSAQNIKIDAASASHLRMDKCVIINANIALSGASDAIVNITGEMEVNLTNASNLEYIGQPVLSGVNISGASTLENKD